MKIANHHLKAERIETSLNCLGEDDWEMKIEAAMLAGTHWANCALHRRGVTSESEDIVHNSMLVVSMLRKYSLAEGELLGALTEIEGSRAAARALELLRFIGALAKRSI
ncbi:hypothetical protein B0G81_1778 [Paraburkholderia sp. BL6665CI2N2]|uniref:hypothetical protein n=1 Tax=Paraburkholderia sp. BL6665CI2N2 TaxID=1938806 RepID=UPI001064E559|nr:hypothetical protein [Paraburkholderia sp. BL6665CI2N2]TDY21555.1 hypothetical protein B0G81_1778 [Paraburkholderia sp. BL6665CI2N2]